MLWLKRLLPIVVIAAAWFGYSYIRTARAEQRTAEDARAALVTAQAWVASAMYRADPQAYRAYRDSLLQANNVSTEELFRHLKTLENDPTRQLSFSQQVNHYVDSLTKKQDSVLKATGKRDTGMVEPQPRVFERRVVR